MLVKSIKALCADIEQGHEFAAFQLCKRLNITDFTEILARVAPTGRVTAKAFDAAVDGFRLWERYRKNEGLTDDESIQ